MCCPKPSPNKLTPINTKNDRAKILMLGLSLTKLAMGSLAHNITSIEMITATIMTQTSLAIPTAVITESKLNTTLIRAYYLFVP